MLIMPLFLIFCIILQQNVPLLRRDVGFHPTFSRHGIAQAGLTLLMA